MVILAMWFIILAMKDRFIINMWFIDLWLITNDLAFGPHYMGLNLHVIGLESRQKWIWTSIQIFFFGLGHDLGRELGPNLVGLNRARGAGLGPKEKTRLLTGPGPSNGSSPQGGFGYEKTQPVAIPMDDGNNEFLTFIRNSVRDSKPLHPHLMLQLYSP